MDNSKQLPEKVVTIHPKARLWMAVRYGRRLPNWFLILMGFVLVAFAFIAAALMRPVPEYLVATAALKPGVPISIDSVRQVPVDLGEVSDGYLLATDLEPGVGVSRVIRPGELLSRADLTFETNPNLTSMRITPKLKPSAQVTPGAKVAIWQVVEQEEGLRVERLVARAEVLDLVYGEGLFAAELPEVEIRISWDQSLLLLESISAEADLYLLPLS